MPHPTRYNHLITANQRYKLATGQEFLHHLLPFLVLLLSHATIIHKSHSIQKQSFGLPSLHQPLSAYFFTNPIKISHFHPPHIPINPRQILLLNYTSCDLQLTNCTGICVETRAPGGNPLGHRANIQTAHRQQQRSSLNLSLELWSSSYITCTTRPHLFSFILSDFTHYSSPCPFISSTFPLY